MLVHACVCACGVCACMHVYACVCDRYRARCVEFGRMHGFIVKIAGIESIEYISPLFWT